MSITLRHNRRQLLSTACELMTKNDWYDAKVAEVADVLQLHLEELLDGILNDPEAYFSEHSTLWAKLNKVSGMGREEAHSFPHAS